MAVVTLAMLDKCVERAKALAMKSWGVEGSQLTSAELDAMRVCIVPASVQPFAPNRIAWSAPSDLAEWIGTPTEWFAIPADPDRREVSDTRAQELMEADPSLSPAMLQAGVKAMLEYEGDDAGEVAAVWRAMCAASPVRENVVEPESPPHNPFRDFRVDRRRIGG